MSRAEGKSKEGGGQGQKKVTGRRGSRMKEAEGRRRRRWSQLYWPREGGRGNTGAGRGAGCPDGLGVGGASGTGSSRGRERWVQQGPPEQHAQEA